MLDNTAANLKCLSMCLAGDDIYICFNLQTEEGFFQMFRIVYNIKNDTFDRDDTPEMVALMEAFINKEFGVDYRDAVAARCLDLVKKICNPSEAVKYVVALNKRSFLWDVLWEYVEKYALKR